MVHVQRPVHHFKGGAPGFGDKAVIDRVAGAFGQLVQGMRQSDVPLRLQNLIPVARLQMHGLGGADLEQGGGRHAPRRRRRQQNKGRNLGAGSQHLGQQAAHGMAHQNRRRLQGGNFLFQVGGVIRQARGGQGGGCGRQVVKAQGGRGDMIAGGFEFLLEPVQRPGAAEGAMDHEDGWLHAYFPSTAMTLR